MRLATTVTPELKAHLSKALVKGYAYANRMFDRDVVLDNSLARQAKPYIRKVAIESFAQRGLSRVPGLVAVPMKNRTGNHEFLELRLGDLRMTFSHLAKINGEQQTLPRECLFRSALAANNPLQTDLLESLSMEDLGILGGVHAMLLHIGNDTPESALLVIADLERGVYLDTLNIPLVVTSNTTAEQVEDFPIEFQELEDEKRQDGRV
jgi:hypothetical protein